MTPGEPSAADCKPESAAVSLRRRLSKRRDRCASFGLIRLTALALVIKVSETVLSAGTLSWTPLNPGLSNVGDVIYALLPNGPTNLFVGGQVGAQADPFTYGLGEWNGHGWSSLGSGTGPVLALAVLDTNLYAGGIFTSVGGVPAGNIAKWDGTHWSALGYGLLGSGGGGTVWALATMGSDLYAGGQFTRINGARVNNADGIAKWNGTNWSSLAGGVGNVFALAVSGTNLYAGGQFTDLSGNGGNHIVRWDGSHWSALGSGMAGNAATSVRALAVSGNNLYVGGSFTSAGGVPANFVARWDGTNWNALGSGIGGSQVSNYVSALTISGTDLYVGGNFTMAGSVAVNNIAKWDGTNWSSLGTGMDQDVLALAISGSHLYAGGRFTTAGGSPAVAIAEAYIGRGTGQGPGSNQVLWTPIPGGALQFAYSGVPGTNYALDRAASLNPPIDWLAQQTNTMPAAGSLLFTNSPLPQQNNFWRIRMVP